MLAGRMKIFAMATTLLTALTVSALQPAQASTDYDKWAKGCSIEGLNYAPVADGEKLSDGTPLAIKGDDRGRNTPVIVIHGLNGGSAHLPDNQVDPSDPSKGKKPILGQFSLPVNLTTNQNYEMKELPSLVRLLQTYPGTSVYSFDYHNYSSKWVTDPHIGQALAESISCLYKQSGEKVIVVAHSMGGLATRQALAIGGSALAAKVSQVVEFGTPNAGSDIDSMLDLVFNASEGLDTVRGGWKLKNLRAKLAECGQDATNSVTNFEDKLRDSCPDLSISSLRSEAGLALRSVSKEIKALPPMPVDIPVHSLAGDMRVSQPEAGYFLLDFAAETDFSLGDEIVPLESAQVGSTTQVAATCNYLFNVTKTVSIFQDIGVMPMGRNPLELGMNFAGRSPCFHGNLMQTLDLVLPAMKYVREDIEARKDSLDAKSLPVPSICGQPAGTLVNGSLPGIPRGMGQTSVISRAEKPKPEESQGAVAAAVALACDKGGVPWPDTVALYDGASQLLGWKTLSDITPGSERNSVVSIITSGKQVRVTWTAQRDGECAACGTVRESANLEWNGTSIQVKDLTAADELPQVAKVLDAINSQDQTKMSAVMAQTFVSKVSAVRSSGGLVSLDKCHPAVDLLWPEDKWIPSDKVADIKALRALPLNATRATDSQRECLLTTAKGEHLVMGLHFDQHSAAWSVAYIG